MTAPRKVIDWDTYFMAIAKFAAQRSKDPNTQVGCVIVNDLHHIVATGYNGLPRGCNENNYPWAREGDYYDTKYPYIEHAEVNAINNSGTNSLINTTMYVSLHPCLKCAKPIINSGIKNIVYLSDKYGNTREYIEAKRMFKDCGIKTRQFVIDEPLVLCIELDNDE